MEVVKENNKALKHPYMDVLKSGLEEQKKLLHHLELRMKIKPSSMDAYQRNEHEITLMRTQAEITSLRRSVNEKEKYFIEFMNQFVIDLEECEKNFDEVLKKATSVSATDEVKKLIATINWKAVYENSEVKVAFYKRFKNMVLQNNKENSEVENFTNVLKTWFYKIIKKIQKLKILQTF